MSTFKCQVFNLTVKEHPNADLLEVGMIGEFCVIIPKGKYKSGDKVVYIPEQAVLPENIIKDLGLEGKLAGSQKNRVKAINLRGILSQGLVYPAKHEWIIGQDVTDELEIKKYEAPIPTHLTGSVSSWDYSVKFDVENYKLHPNVFKDGEIVILTEKIHGTCTVATLVTDPLSERRKEDMVDGRWAISSKGLSHKYMYFIDNQENQNNLYIRAFNQKIRKMLDLEFGQYNELVTFFGETFGRVQDLKYGNEKDISFRMFGIRVGNKFWDFEKMVALCDAHGIDTVPILYKGPFSKEVLEKYTNGKEQISGKELHIREGVVIYPEVERFDPEIGRVFLKNVSGNYLCRNGGTEFN